LILDFAAPELWKMNFYSLCITQFIAFLLQ
jgi:hypothetical protein